VRVSLMTDSHKSSQGWKVSFWGSARGTFSVNIKMNDFVGNILYIYIGFTPAATSWNQVDALHADAHLSTALLCYFRCNWCRNLAAVNCILPWIVLTLSTLQIGITLVI